jgi:hypothetical protein
MFLQFGKNIVKYTTGTLQQIYPKQKRMYKIEKNPKKTSTGFKYLDNI